MKKLESLLLFLKLYLVLKLLSWKIGILTISPTFPIFVYYIILFIMSTVNLFFGICDLHNFEVFVYIKWSPYPPTSFLMGSSILQA